MKEREQQKRAMPEPGLLLAWRPPDIDCDDRAAIGDELVLGRSTTATWCITDRMLSRNHFSVVREPESGGVLVRDLGSSNKTYVEGQEVNDVQRVPPGGLIRAGDCLFVVAEDLGALKERSGMPSTELIGRFHAAGLVRRLDEIARAGRHALLMGESGYRKAAATKTYHKLLDKYADHGRPGKLVTLKVARSVDEFDAIEMLFGVAANDGGGKKGQKGALQAAQKGTLFLDDAQRLPFEVQMQLLLFAEDGALRQSQEQGEPRKLDVKLVLGSSPTSDHEEKGYGLLADLITRFEKLELAPLRERRADIPSIFNQQIRRQLDPGTAGDLVDCLEGYVVERLLLHDYRQDNEGELVELVERLEKMMLEGESPEQALALGFEEVLGLDPRNT